MYPGAPESNRPSRAAGSAAGNNAAECPRVLIVSGNAERLDSLTRTMRQDDVICGLAGTTDAALKLVMTPARPGKGARYEVVLYDLERCSPGALNFVREMAELDVATIIICPDVSFDEAVQAMRAGASDIVSGHLKPRDLHKRVRSAILQQRNQIERAAAPTSATADDGIPVLEDVDPEAARVAGRGLARSRPDHLIAGSVGKARKIKDVPAGPEPSMRELAAQFGGVIRCELDVESLLRHALEFVLAHAGPTNAAVFLPAQSGDFSLGAYVNFSCPKETVEVLLDHLANVAAPRLETTVGVLHLKDDDAIEQHVGQGTDWLKGHEAVCFCCRNEGECLAVFMLFREKHAGFGPELVDLLGMLAEKFGEQLARVVKIHHRHLPKDKWGKLGEPAEDNEDLGGGGLAA